MASMGPLIPPFWTSCDVCPRFQIQGGFPRLPASSPACNGFLSCFSFKFTRQTHLKITDKLMNCLIFDLGRKGLHV